MRRPLLRSLQINSVLFYQPRKHNSHSFFSFSDNFNQTDKKSILDSFIIKHDYVNEEIETLMMNDLNTRFKRIPYEKDHWDDAIINFREIQNNKFRKHATMVVAQIKNDAFSEDDKVIQNAHVLDLHEDGYIKPHIDSIRVITNRYLFLF